MYSATWAASPGTKGGIRSGANELNPDFCPNSSHWVKGLRLPRVKPQVLTLSSCELSQKGEQGWSEEIQVLGLRRGHPGH